MRWIARIWPVALRDRWARVGGTLPEGCHRLVLVLLMLAVAVGLTRAFVVFPAGIEGKSMSPTLRDGHVYWVNRLAYISQSPRRGDIVCLWTGKERLAKRVIGLPHEQLAIQNGVVFVNNQPLAEPYVVFRGDWSICAGTIGGGHYVVVGDNRSRPRSVQDALLVRRDRILGKVIGIRPDRGHRPGASRVTSADK